MTSSPKSCRNGSAPCEPQRLVESMHCAAHHGKLPLAQVADAIRMSPKRLSDAVNPYEDRHHFQLDRFIGFLQATDNLAPLRFISRRVNSVVLLLPEGAAGTSDFRRNYMEAAKEFGDVAQLFEEAIANDGRIDAAEAERIKKAIFETHEVLRQMEHTLDGLTVVGSASTPAAQAQKRGRR
jgi:hypothetical protein